MRFGGEIQKLERAYKCSYTVFNQYHNTVRFYPVWNDPTVICVINRNDWNDLLKLSNKEVTLPIRIDAIKGKGNGLRASRNILQNELVAVYSGIVMSCVQAQKVTCRKGYYVDAFRGPGNQ